MIRVKAYDKLNIWHLGDHFIYSLRMLVHELGIFNWVYEVLIGFIDALESHLTSAYHFLQHCKILCTFRLIRDSRIIMIVSFPHALNIILYIWNDLSDYIFFIKRILFIFFNLLTLRQRLFIRLQYICRWLSLLIIFFKIL